MANFESGDHKRVIETLFATCTAYIEHSLRQMRQPCNSFTTELTGAVQIKTSGPKDLPDQPRPFKREDGVRDLSTFSKLMRQRTLSDTSSKTRPTVVPRSDRNREEEDYFNTPKLQLAGYDPTAEQLRLELDACTSSTPPTALPDADFSGRSGPRAADYAKGRSEYSRRMAENCIIRNGRRLKGIPTVQRTRRHCTVYNTALTRPVVDKLAEVVGRLKARTTLICWMWWRCLDVEELRCDVQQQRDSRGASLEAARLLEC